MSAYKKKKIKQLEEFTISLAATPVLITVPVLTITVAAIQHAISVNPTKSEQQKLWTNKWQPVPQWKVIITKILPILVYAEGPHKAPSPILLPWTSQSNYQILLKNKGDYAATNKLRVKNKAKFYTYAFPFLVIGDLDHT